MKPAFEVRSTRRFDRMARALRRQHPGAFTEAFADAVRILGEDPHGSGGRHSIRKLVGVAAGMGEYRLRLGRWRFRYDIDQRVVLLHYAGLRREDSYRRPH